MSIPTEPYQFSCIKWIRRSIFNLFIVALAGVVLRYKINYPLPFIDQKNLLHGHSHFAFVGWVSLALMALMVNYLIRSGLVTNYKKYHWLCIANTITAYGMLIAFILQGYARYSITFSTLSIFVSYFFIFYYWKDLKNIPGSKHINIWFKFALALLGLSSIGPFALAYLMANHIFIQDFYFAAIYFFLHFQYNGWFIFACFGLLFSFLKQQEGLHLIKVSKHLFLILALTVIPSYLLSVIGLRLPAYLFWTAALSGIVQLSAAFYFHRLLQTIRSIPTLAIGNITCFLWMLAYISFALKLVLQSISIIPYFAEFAFSLRPVIIAYLHLCFLGVISFFILGCCALVLAQENISIHKTGLLIFVFGVLVQEAVLMAQGMDAILFQGGINTGIILLLAAVVMATGLSIVFIKLFIPHKHKKAPL